MKESNYKKYPKSDVKQALADFIINNTRIFYMVKGKMHLMEMGLNHIQLFNFCSKRSLKIVIKMIKAQIV